MNWSENRDRSRIGTSPRRELVSRGRLNNVFCCPRTTNMFYAFLAIVFVTRSVEKSAWAVPDFDAIRRSSKQSGVRRSEDGRTRLPTRRTKIVESESEPIATTISPCFLKVSHSTRESRRRSGSPNTDHCVPRHDRPVQARPVLASRRTDRESNNRLQVANPKSAPVFQTDELVAAACAEF